MRMRISIMILSALVPLVTSCDLQGLHGAQSRIGVSIDASGVPLIEIVLCSNEKLITADLTDEDPQPSGTSSALKYLWKVRSTQESFGGQYSFSLSGEAPSGFVVEVPFTASLGSVSSLGVGDVVEGRKTSGAGWVFRVDQLRQGQVLNVDDELQTTAEFRESAAKSC
jgi:hypothetical protein